VFVVPPFACFTSFRSATRKNALSLALTTGAAFVFQSAKMALLGAIVLSGLGGAGANVAVEQLAHAASGHDLVLAFRFVFMAVALVLAFGLCFMISLEEKPLRGPAAEHPVLETGAPASRTPPQ